MITPKAMAVLEQHFEHINWTPDSDPTRFVDENFTWFTVAEGATACGPEGYEDVLRRWKRACPDCWWELSALYGGSRISCELVLRGAHTGPLTTSQGFAPATGRAVELPMCEIYHIAGGKLLAIHSYYNLAALLGQLGRSYVQPIAARQLVPVN